jgi:hypothetical protein
MQHSFLNNFIKKCVRPPGRVRYTCVHMTNYMKLAAAKFATHAYIKVTLQKTNVKDIELLFDGN